MDPKIVERPEIKLLGVEVRTTNAEEREPASARIPGLWGRFLGQRLAETIPSRRDPGVVVAAYTHYQSDHTGPYSLIVGEEVSVLGDAPAGMVGLTLPEARYLVFAAQGNMPEAIMTTWSVIWDYFSETSPHERAYTCDFERHDPKTPSQVDIFIAIR